MMERPFIYESTPGRVVGKATAEEEEEEEEEEEKERDGEEEKGKEEEGGKVKGNSREEMETDFVEVEETWMEGGNGVIVVKEEVAASLAQGVAGVAGVTEVTGESVIEGVTEGRRMFRRDEEPSKPHRRKKYIGFCMDLLNGG